MSNVIRFPGGDVAAQSAMADILDRTRMHAEMVCRMLNGIEAPPADLAEFLEDVANVYLDHVEEITRWRRGSAGSAPG
ncbi:hypothetical protein [Mangrovibrevibacter kandeliae]|uniref:hypothetical protein n=1 Tax=Mangrovibrevibacter kandeliae TaxID=2968473 RepID=UPI0021173ADB|nr:MULTISPECIES: hypothetical protein [unclassified Aurantimonas]MCQ8781656.1 hypothetical protein [Aurantimonas sp. CSK15Z-1]MCW4114896.1 hypothetical protein [Aurantimonas sp. MSK8Z-1]